MTYHDGILDEVDIYRSGLTYIEKGNLVCNGSGNMGSYYDYVYTIQDGLWRQIGYGEYREDYESRTEYSIDYLYEWNGESVTEDEFEQIQEQIIQEGKTDISFWIGAMCGQGQENHGFHCLVPGMDLGYDMLSLYNALWYGFWWKKQPDDEPGYDGLTEDGEKVREGFVMMRYSKDDGRYYYWDMPDNVLAARESLTGKIGYICEFDGRQ